MASCKKSNLSVSDKIWADEDSHSEPDNFSSDEECASVCERVECGNENKNFENIQDDYQSDIDKEQNSSTTGHETQQQQQTTGRKRRRNRAEGVRVQASNKNRERTGKNKSNKAVWKEVQDHIPDTPTFTAQPGLQVLLVRTCKLLTFSAIS